MLDTKQHYPPRELKEFVDWFEKANPGDTYTYFNGDLAYAQSTTTARQTAIKMVTWQYAVEGKIYLYQRRMPDDSRDYIAYKPRRVIQKLIALDYGTKRYKWNGK